MSIHPPHPVPVRMFPSTVAWHPLILPACRCPQATEVFRANLSFFTLILDGRLYEPRREPASLPEELRSAILECTRLLLEHCSDEAAASMQREEALPIVGHAIHVLLEGVRAMTSVNTVPLQLCEQHLTTVAALVRRIGNGATLASFLPGVSTTLSSVLLSSRQNSTVIIAALDAWEAAVPPALEDAAFPNPTVGAVGSFCDGQ